MQEKNKNSHQKPFNGSKSHILKKQRMESSDTNDPIITSIEAKENTFRQLCKDENELTKLIQYANDCQFPSDIQFKSFSSEMKELQELIKTMQSNDNEILSVIRNIDNLKNQIQDKKLQVSDRISELENNIKLIKKTNEDLDKRLAASQSYKK